MNRIVAIGSTLLATWAISASTHAQTVERVLVIDEPAGLAAALRMELAPAGLAVVTAGANDCRDHHCPDTLVREAALRAHATAAVWVAEERDERRLHVLWLDGGASEASFAEDTQPRTVALLASSLLEEARSTDPLGPPAPSHRPRLDDPALPEPEVVVVEEPEEPPPGPRPGTVTVFFQASTGFGWSRELLASTTRISAGVTIEPGIRFGLGGLLLVGEETRRAWLLSDVGAMEQRWTAATSTVMAGLEMGYARTWGPVFFQAGFAARVGYVEAIVVDGATASHLGELGYSMGLHIGIGFVVGDGVTLVLNTDAEGCTQLGPGSQSLMGASLGLDWH